MPTVLIAGANRGLGLAFVKSYLAKGWDVIACVRDPSSMIKVSEGMKVFKLDIASLTDSKIVAGELLAHQIKLDVIIVNAAVSLDPSNLLDTPIAMLDLSYETNTQGPLVLFQAMRPHLVDGGKFAVVSSTLGCTGAIKRAGKGAYGMSHAARNYMVRKLQIENPEIVVLSLNPGHMDTHMGWRGARWYNSTSTGQDVYEVARLIDIVDKATQDTYGGWMIDLKGERVPL